MLALDANEVPRFGHVTFVLGQQVVATLNNEEDFHQFSIALQRLNRKQANIQSPKGVLRVLLQVANDSADIAIDRIADELERSAKEISEISDGYNAQGK